MLEHPLQIRNLQSELGNDISLYFSITFEVFFVDFVGEDRL